MIRFLYFMFLIFPLGLQAQFTYQLDQDIPVRDMDGSELSMPWAGGLNAAHYNTMDINLDGKDDLVVFDRMADKVVTFLNVANQYQHHPEYESFFPADITNWLLLRDINCDGKKDIFTGDILGMKVYINVTEAGENPAWEQFMFYSGPGGTKSPVLLTKGFSGKINLQLQFDDLPSIVDADGDGDLDIFNVRFVGNGTVEYHKNFSMERYGRCDSLDFERQTQKWGGFTECSCGTFAFNNADCPPVIGGRTEHAGGKSLLAIDIDGDNNVEMLFSEASCSTLFLLKNEGTVDNPVINSSSPYPSGSPVSFTLFPAPFFEDLDFDGKKDLVAIPNIFSKLFLNSDLSHSSWFYKNSGTNAVPAFNFSKTNFLQENMIDVGDNSVPAFTDYDGDGDYDLFVSQNNDADFVARIKLFENTGTSESPEFKLVNEDIWGLSQSAFYNMKIQFVDVNRDSRTDLVFTATSFQTNQTKLYYALSQGNTIIDFTGQSVQATDFTIGINENILVTDINQDGLPDLLVGRTSGALEFWKNTGPEGVLTFSLEDESYLGLASTVLRQNIAPFIADCDGNGKSDLILGDQSGQLKIIPDFRDAVDDSGTLTELTFNTLLNEYESKNLGGRTWPVATNLYNATRPAIVVGNILGGLTVLKNDGGQSLPEEPVLDIFPNPLKKSETLILRTDRAAAVQMFSALGQVLTSLTTVPPNEDFTYKMPSLNAGIYILRFTINNKTLTRRIVIY